MVSEPWLTIYYRIYVKKFNTVYLLSNDNNLTEKNNIKIVKINSKIYSPLEQFEILFKNLKIAIFLVSKLQRPNPSFSKINSFIFMTYQC